MEELDIQAFLKEREVKLGSPIIWKTYATFFSRLNGEKRDYGVFVFSDGNTLNIEDFERVPSIMGIALPFKRKKEKYEKLELSFPIEDISSIELVTKSSADACMKKRKDISKKAGAVSRAFRKLVTKVQMKNGDICFFELMSHKEFKAWIENIQKEIENGSIQGL